MKKTRLIKIILKRTGALKFLTTYIIIFAGVSIGVWIVEPNIKTPIDSVWYCFSVATTIGFGDITAVTILGRAMSIFLSICSILIINCHFSYSHLFGGFGIRSSCCHYYFFVCRCNRLIRSFLLHRHCCNGSTWKLGNASPAFGDDIFLIRLFRGDWGNRSGIRLCLCGS